MATVELSFSALPAHVRTARLVAAAVARRAGVEESVLDEVRLAVGEACSRAVDVHRRQFPDELVHVSLTDEPLAFHVQVSDHGRLVSDQDVDRGGMLDSLDQSDLDFESLPDGVGLAVISGLVDDMVLVPDADGTSVRMTWPVAAASRDGAG